jgi:hypothetical protein
VGRIRVFGHKINLILTYARCLLISISEPRGKVTRDLLHKSEKLTISNFGFWILDFGLRDLGLLQEV